MNTSEATEKLLGERMSSPPLEGRDTSGSQSTFQSQPSYFTGKLPISNRMGSLNNQDYPNELYSTKKSIKRDDGDYYWANFEWKWTLLDQKRLVSMDYLIHRSLEFHNNHHTFRASGNFDYTEPMGDALLSDHAMEVQVFHPDYSAAPPSQLLQFGDILNNQLSNYAMDSTPSCSFAGIRHIYWFNLKDIRSLRSLADHLQLDNIAVSLFYDLRGHSTIVALENGLFMSFCIVTLNGDDAELHKVYCYCTQSYMITFERELISEPDDDDGGMVSNYRSPLSFDDYDSSSVHMGKRLHSTQGHENEQNYTISILSVLYSRMRTDLFGPSSRLGTLYMLYEIGMESLSHSDSMIEFVSRTIFYLKQQVHKKLTYTQKLHFYRKAHILLATLNLADCLVDETYKNLEKIFNKTSTQFSALLQRSEFSNDHLAYISLLIDSYEFTSTCLERQIEDVHALENVMGHISSIRGEKVSTNLSLIATVFLPITFLASAFGMNFEKNGDYTMEILNSPQGPHLFYGMCLVVIILNLIAFLHSGLVTIRDTEAIIRPQTSNNSLSKFMNCFSPAVSRENSRESVGSDESFDHLLRSSHSQKSIRTLLDSKNMKSVTSSDSLHQLGLASGTDLERLDRESIDDQSMIEEFRRQSIAKSRRTLAALKTC